MASESSHPLVEDDGDLTDDELAVTVDAKPILYRWRLENFSELRQKARGGGSGVKITSEEWKAGGVPWRLLLFPNGNEYKQMVEKCLSLYLEVPGRESLSFGWRRDAQFWLSIVDQKDPARTIKKEARVELCDSCVDSGFPDLVSFEELNKPENGYLVDDVLILEAELFVHNVYNPEAYWGTYSHNSRKDFGYVGLCNQGATCYLNSLMQGLFHLGVFRRAVYLMNTASDDVKVSIPLALQRLFFKMQFDDHAPGTKELTRSFGWSDFESFKQHDVQELNRVLMDNLETKMKGTPVQEAEGYIEHLFTGQMENFIRCIHVPFRSVRPEVFYDLSLVVKGMKDIYESIENYVAIETLEGQNKYQAEGFGLQDAHKGVRFLKLPPVLNVQLKRWEMDFYRMQPYKVNDLYMFYPILDMTKYLDRSINQDSGIYHLHAVLVHSGGVGGGHYYAYIKPNTRNRWFKFNDQMVSSASEKEAIDDNWGGEEVGSFDRYGQRYKYAFQRSANAYMLIYVRETEVHRYMNDDCADAIPPHLSRVAEEHLQVDLRVATEKDLAEHNQSLFDLVQSSKVAPQRHKKTESLLAFKPKAAEIFGIPPEQQRYWLFQRRGEWNANGPVRPVRSLTEREMREPLQNLMSHRSSEQLLLLLPADPNPETGVPPEAKERDNSVLIFFKLYNAATSSVSYIGHTMVSKSDDNWNSIQARFRQAAGDRVPADAELLLWEETGFDNRVRRVLPTMSFADIELGHGNILVYMVAPQPGEPEHRHPTPAEWYPYIRDRMVVEFRSLAEPDNVEKRFSLECQKTFTYEEVQRVVGTHLGADPAKIRFTGMTSNQPRIAPCDKTANLQKMINLYYDNGPEVLFFELLTVRLDQIELMKKVKIEYHCANGKSLPPITLYVPKNGVIRDIFPLLREVKEVKEVLASPVEEGLTTATGQFRLIELWSSKIGRVWNGADPTIHLYEYTTFVVQETLAEEVDFKPETDLLIHVSHISLPDELRIPTLHGRPFFFVVKKTETFASVKERIRQKLQLTPEEIAPWKLYHCSYSVSKLLTDTATVGQHSWDRVSSYLGLEHPDPQASRGGASANYYSHRSHRETGIVLKN